MEGQFRKMVKVGIELAILVVEPAGGYVFLALPVYLCGLAFLTDWIEKAPGPLQFSPRYQRGRTWSAGRIPLYAAGGLVGDGLEAAGQGQVGIAGEGAG